MTAPESNPRPPRGRLPEHGRRRKSRAKQSVLDAAAEAIVGSPVLPHRNRVVDDPAGLVDQHIHHHVVIQDGERKAALQGSFRRQHRGDIVLEVAGLLGKVRHQHGEQEHRGSQSAGEGERPRTHQVVDGQRRGPDPVAGQRSQGGVSPPPCDLPGRQDPEFGGQLRRRRGRRQGGQAGSHLRKLLRLPLAPRAAFQVRCNLAAFSFREHAVEVSRYSAIHSLALHESTLSNSIRAPRGGSHEAAGPGSSRHASAFRRHSRPRKILDFTVPSEI